jgi:hypothetical protein
VKINLGARRAPAHATEFDAALQDNLMLSTPGSRRWRPCAASWCRDTAMTPAPTALPQPAPSACKSLNSRQSWVRRCGRASVSSAAQPGRWGSAGTPAAVHTQSLATRQQASNLLESPIKHHFYLPSSIIFRTRSGAYLSLRVDRIDSINFACASDLTCASEAHPPRCAHITPQAKTQPTAPAPSTTGSRPGSCPVPFLRPLWSPHQTMSLPTSQHRSATP